MYYRFQSLDGAQIDIPNDATHEAGTVEVGTTEIGTAEVGTTEIGTALQLHLLPQQ